MAEPDFKFPHQAILDHTGSTRNFEVLQPILNGHTTDIDSLDRDVTQLERAVGAIKAVLPADSGWLAVSFENSWKNLGGAFLTAAYRKQGNTVRLRGTIEGGLSAKAAFTLPAGFRPTGTTFSSVGQGAGSPANLSVTAAGVVTPSAAAISTIGLDSITFTVD